MPARWEGALCLVYGAACTACLVPAAQRHDGTRARAGAMPGFVPPLAIVTPGVFLVRRGG